MNSVNSARFSARCLAPQGKPWDLMAWGFQQAQSNRIGHVHKNLTPKQQAAEGAQRFTEQHPNIKVDHQVVPQDYAVKLQTLYAAGTLEAAITAALRRFLHPLTGGPDGTGQDQRVHQSGNRDGAHRHHG